MEKPFHLLYSMLLISLSSSCNLSSPTKSWNANPHLLVWVHLHISKLLLCMWCVSILTRGVVFWFTQWDCGGLVHYLIEYKNEKKFFLMFLPPTYMLLILVWQLPCENSWLMSWYLKSRWQPLCQWKIRWTAKQMWYITRKIFMFLMNVISLKIS